MHNHTTRGMLQACCCIVDVAEATCGKSLSLQRNVYIFLKLPKSRPAQQAIIPVSCALRIIFEQPPERAHPTPCQPGESFPKALPMCRWRYQPWKNQRTGVQQESKKKTRRNDTFLQEVCDFSGYSKMQSLTSDVGICWVSIPPIWGDLLSSGGASTRSRKTN